MRKAFNIHIDQAILDDLKARLAQTRWPDETDNGNWQYGTNMKYLQELCAYWKNEFDWKKTEQYLNGFNHFKAAIGGVGIHFIHEKGKGKNAIPLLLTHGYPDSFLRFLKVLPLLTAANNDVCFDVVVPSIPGFGFSDKPGEPGTDPQKIANLFSQLMTEELGYQQFIAQGGDWGSSITESIAIQHPELLMGFHLTDIPYQHLFSVAPDDLTPAEKKFMETGKEWQMKEGGYAIIQSTKPQTLGYALNDSPAGLASWIIEKFYRWSDCNGQLENTYTKDELLANLTIYWATQTINSANRIYYETMQSNAKNKAAAAPPKITVPAAISLYPKDLIAAPREYADRIYNVQQWTEMPKGGHFAAMEQPALFAADIKKFAKTVLTKSKASSLVM